MLALLLPLLSACGGNGGDDGAANNAGPAPTSAATGGGTDTGTTPAPGGQAATGNNGTGKLEMFSWWTNGGEADGLKAMYDVYKRKYPNIEIVNATVAGGAGTNAKAVLVTRMNGNKPPDSFQVHAGQELIGTWVSSEKVEPITDILEEAGVTEALPELLVEQITFEDEIYSVPVNIHRSNMLWYNKKVFEDNDLEPPKTLDDFFEVAEALKAKGITPLAVGGKDKFETPHLFESVLLATYGDEDYPKLFEADTEMWGEDKMDEAIDTLAKMLSYANTDRSSLGWADAAQQVLDGKAGMTIMGDWAEGYFVSKGAKPDVEFGYVPAPGTDGIFMWLSDSFALPKGAPNREAAVNWITLAGSKEGQDAFNPKKGSIPARTDADKDLYDEYLQYSIDRFQEDKLAPSVVHGAAANENYMTEYGNALNVFSSDLDKEQLKQSLEDAAAALQVE